MSGRKPPAPLTTTATLAALPHDQLVDVALEHMLTGHLIDRALMPEVIIALGMDAMAPIAIDEWMGASPNYTARLRRLMGIEGDGVDAIVKALQLDVGFVHEYMDVAYRIHDHDHAEFWLQHCGALVDTEPMGEQTVISMCHHIEDPTFDATALAHNPRVRIRPIHRPPRAPADRVPVCHWTIAIDAANEPIGAAPITGRVADLALASTPLPPIADTGDGLADYAGDVRPDFRLYDLSSGALAAVTREFALQSQLIASAAVLALTDRAGAEVARAASTAQAQGVAWVASERLARVLDVGERPGADGIALVLAVSPLWCSGVEATVTADRGDVEVSVEGAPGLLDPGQPGWLGLLAGGEAAPLAAAVHGLDPTAVVEPDGPLRWRVRPGAGEPVAAPRAVEMLRISSATNWRFRRDRSRRGG